MIKDDLLILAIIAFNPQKFATRLPLHFSLHQLELGYPKALSLMRFLAFSALVTERNFLRWLVSPWHF
jgi:hypothetical protein